MAGSAIASCVAAAIAFRSWYDGWTHGRVVRLSLRSPLDVSQSISLAAG